MDTPTTLPTSEFTPMFKRGDIVRLNSGGPQMTVQEPAADEGDSVECMWFVGDVYDTVKTKCFFEECLTLVTP